jgi:predicted P-loop ATPase
MSFLVTFWDDLYAKSFRAETVTAEELGDIIKSTTAPEKAKLPLLTFGRFGSLRSPPGPDGKGGGALRWEGNMPAVTGVTIDHDAGTMPFQEAVDRANARQLSFVAYTTARHTPQAPRWRVHFPYANELPLSQHSRMTDRGNGLFGGVAAGESWSPSQAWFVGFVDNVPCEFAIGDGDENIDEAEELDKIRRGKPGGKTKKTKTGKPDLKNLDEDELKEEITSGRSPFHASARLLWLWALEEIPKADAQAELEAIFDSIPPADRRNKWPAHRAAIPHWVDRMYARAAKHLGTFLARLVSHFEEDALWRGALRHNQFTQTIEVCDPFPPQPGQVFDTYRALREVDTLEALLIVQTKGFPKASISDVWRAIILAAEHQGYHPVREYLDGLVWDETPRIHRLFFDYFPGELPEDDCTPPPANALSWRDKWVAYYEATAQCFMIGAVARIFEPGCKVDSLPIFVSEQRYYKGLGLQALVGNPKWFSDDVPVDVVDRDAKDALVGKWIVELSETPHLKRDIEKFKAFVSRTTDRFRRAYERLTQDWPRQTALTGTSNDLGYLDPTGNRRHWAIPLATPVNVEKIKEDRDQLWAEAVHLYKDKIPWWLTNALEDIADEIQSGYVDRDILDDTIADWLKDKVPDTTKAPDPQTNPVPAFTPNQLYAGIGTKLGLGVSLGLSGGTTSTIPSKADQMRVANCLKRLGFRQRRQWVNGGKATVWMQCRRWPYA